MDEVPVQLTEALAPRAEVVPVQRVRDLVHRVEEVPARDVHEIDPPHKGPMMLINGRTV